MTGCPCAISHRTSREGFNLCRWLCDAAYRQTRECQLGRSFTPPACMNVNEVRPSLILVIEDVEETRIAIEQLLHADRYRVVAVQDEDQAVRQSLLAPP